MRHRLGVVQPFQPLHPLRVTGWPAEPMAGPRLAEIFSDRTAFEKRQPVNLPAQAPCLLAIFPDNPPGEATRR